MKPEVTGAGEVYNRWLPTPIQKGKGLSPAEQWNYGIASACTERADLPAGGGERGLFYYCHFNFLNKSVSLSLLRSLT